MLMGVRSPHRAGGARGRVGSAGREVVVYLSIDQPFTEPILRDYERQSGVKVRAVWDRRGLAPGSSVLPARPREVGVTAVVIAAGSALLRRRP